MIQNLPGFRDFYPTQCSQREVLFAVWRKTASQFNFKAYDAPILEELSLFTQKSGQEICNQLFNFEDKGSRSVALRPEMTPSLVRMIAARLPTIPKPIKWFHIGEHFRYERPQKGRLRSFYQYNADIVGDPTPAADAECIALLINTFCEFGLTAEHIKVRLSDRNLWVYYLEYLKIPTEAIIPMLSLVDKFERMKLDQFRIKLAQIISCSEAQIEIYIQAIENLMSIKTFDALTDFIQKLNKDAFNKRLYAWEELLNRLESMGLSSFVEIDLGIVRGLAYYTGFVFEAFERSGSGRALAGGGRYDTLFEKLTGTIVPAVGFAMGDVTLQDLLSELNLLPEVTDNLEIYTIICDNQLYPNALKSIQLLRQNGYYVEYNLQASTINKQIKIAFQLKAHYALIYTKNNQINANTVLLKNLKEHTESWIESSQLLKLFPCK